MSVDEEGGSGGSKKKQTKMPVTGNTCTLTPAPLFDTFAFESDEQKNALLHFIAQYKRRRIPKKPVFLVGQAGTGKSVLGLVMKRLFYSDPMLATAGRDGNVSPMKIVHEDKSVADMEQFLQMHMHPDYVMKFTPLLIGNAAPPADTPGMDNVTVVRMKPLAPENIVADPGLANKIVEEELMGVLERCMLATAAE